MSLAMQIMEVWLADDLTGNPPHANDMTAMMYRPESYDTAASLRDL
ncbi:MAG: hypothetical protein IPK61_07810 [Saprospiraceae bacterium]|jgi:hypothetical protein|nr:hypothetical protein [Saprospiraceae bacterium]MBK9379045.1 hypothetical protein [Saprospiraceae bacterium]MBX7162671.1 hypothetical protein [Saprospiraceae bacterium]